MSKRRKPRPREKARVMKAKSRPPVSSKVQRESRLLEIEALMVEITADSVICATISEKHDISIRQVYRDILSIQDRWHEEGKEEAPTRRAKMRKFLFGLAIGAKNAGKWNAAVAAATRLMELDGLRTMKHEHTGEVSIGIEGKTSADKRSRLEELMAKAKGAEAKVGEKVIH